MPDNNNTLHVLLNKQLVLEFDRNKPTPEIQLEYLNNMDARLDAGIQVGNKTIVPKNQLEKAQYVANNMVNSLLKDDFNQAIAMCTYLGNRLKDLKQVVCVGKEDDSGMQIEFVYDRNLQQQQQEQTIKFFDPKDYQKH